MTSLCGNVRKGSREWEKVSRGYQMFLIVFDGFQLCRGFREKANGEPAKW
jgi:hypothetical protein